MAKKKSREELGWTLIAAGAAVVAGIAARNAMEVAWREARGKEPPANPAKPEVAWHEALTWTAITSLIVGLARLFARRGAAAGYKRLTGRLPPGL